MSNKKIDKKFIIDLIGKDTFENVENIKNQEFEGVNNFSIDRARDYFIKNTYEKEINKEFDNIFDSLFPIDELQKSLKGDLRKKLDEALKNITNDDETIRLKASKKLLKESSNEINIFTIRLIAHHITIKTVLSVLEKETNKKIIENLIQILDNISSRLKCKDLRIYNGVKIFFEQNSSKLIKTLVMLTLSNFDNPEKWEYVYEVLKNKPNRLALSYIRGIIGSYYRKDNGFQENLSKNMREKLVKLLKEEDIENTDVKESIEYLEDGRFRCYETGKMVYIS